PGLVAPPLTVSDCALMNARCSAADRTANITLIVPKLSYGMIDVNRLIVDESANEDALRLLVTADRISATDSLDIDNVNLSNVMAGDSLHFNLKLSDITASNQLDLNGLVNFDRGSPTRIRMLPSALVLNSEPWRLDNNATAYVNSGEIDIRGFEISNQGQVARLEGLISATRDRDLTFTFKNFNLATFNPLVASSSIKLSGILDGHMDVASVLD